MVNKNLAGYFSNPALRSTPAREKAAPGQVKSDQGGYVFKVDDMERARRFLILGSDSSFYKSGAKLTIENAEVIQKLAKSEKARELLALIYDVSVNGRAPKQSPGLFALALVIGTTEDPKVKNLAYQLLPEIARTASTLFEFVSYLSQFQKLGGMGFQKAIGRWYNEKELDQLAYQMVKYRQRNEYDHSRLLRLSKRVKSNERPELSPLLDWALGKPVDVANLPRVARGFELAKKDLHPGELPNLIRSYGLSWEMLPTEALNDVKVWDALLDGNVPLGALIRQLPRLTNLGIIQALGGRTAEIEDRLTDTIALKKARIHPIQALVAMRTYGRGRGRSSTWSPVNRIVAALEQAFYRSFKSVEPTGKRLYLGIDVSGSMDSPYGMSDDIPLTPREIATVMAMVVARTEREHYFGAFQDQIVPLHITAGDSLESAMRETGKFPFCGTNLSLPMHDAMRKDLQVDAFILYTDNENGLGSTHPFQALERYRRESGIQSKIVVNAVTATRFSMADPRDNLALDIAGFDTSAPQLINEFIK